VAPPLKPVSNSTVVPLFLLQVSGCLCIVLLVQLHGVSLTPPYCNVSVCGEDLKPPPPARLRSNIERKAQMHKKVVLLSRGEVASQPRDAQQFLAPRPLSSPLFSHLTLGDLINSSCMGGSANPVCH
jgi:hypothetical protein